jgi:hypothetical protein
MMKSLIAILLGIFVLVACGGNAPTPPNPLETPKITRLEITPGSVLLTAPEETQVFSIQAYDQNNTPVNAVATWSSSNAAVVSITSAGQATAGAKLGSVMLTAQVGDVKAVTVAVVARVPSGTTLVTDAQVVKLVAVNPNAKFQVGYQYTVTLEGIPTPALGSMVLARESASIAGKVIAVTVNGTQTLVTLEVVPIPDLFTKLELNEVVDLSNVEPKISDATREFFDVTNNGKGQYTFTLKAGKVLTTTARNSALQNQRLSAQREFDVGPLKCEATAGAIKVELNKAETSIDLTSLQFKLDWSEAQKNILLVGAPKTTIAYKPRLGTALEGKLACKFEFFELNIPFPGFISFVFGARIPIGAGFELEGKMPLVGIGFDATLENTTTLRVGVDCNPSCGFVKEVTTQAKSEWKWVIPDIFQGIKLEVSAYAFFYANVNAGPQGIFRTLGIEAGGILKFFEVKAGVKLEGKLASEATQAADKDYVADYKSSVEVGITPSVDTIKVLQLFSVLVPDTLEFKVAFDVDTSPVATATANQNTFKAGDNLKFNVKLDKVKFLPLDFNVESIAIYRKEAGELILVTETPITDGQTNIEIPWVATLTGAIGTNFIVFAKTKVLPILKLELTTVIPKQLTGKIVFDITVNDSRLSESGMPNQVGYQRILKVSNGAYRIEGIATIGAAEPNIAITSASGSGTYSSTVLNIVAAVNQTCKLFITQEEISIGLLSNVSSSGVITLKEEGDQSLFGLGMRISISGGKANLKPRFERYECPEGIRPAPNEQQLIIDAAHGVPVPDLFWRLKTEEAKKGTHRFTSQGSRGTVSWDFTEPQ